MSFREDVIRRRTIFELNKARDRAHTLVGLAIAVENLDPVIELIRSAPSPQDAKDALLSKAWPAGDVEPLVILIDEPTVRWKTVFTIFPKCRPRPFSI